MGSKVIGALLVAGILTLPTAAENAAFSLLPLDSTNEYRLITEQELTPARQGAINEFIAQKEQAGVFLSDHAGAQIYYRSFIDPNEVGAVVIVSGRTESSRIYSELIYELMRQHYSVYIYDHRGQGSSGGRLHIAPERGYIWTFDHYVADLEKFVNDVVLRTKHRNLFLLAHSMGGAIASLYLEKPGVKTPFKAMALVTPMHEPLLPVKGLELTKQICLAQEWFGSYLDPAGYVKGTEAYEVSSFGENDLTHSRVRYDAMQSVYRDHPKLRVEYPTRSWIRAACAAGKEAQANASKIKIPVLLLQASKDTAVLPDAQVAFCKRMKTCEGLIIEQAYHAILLESDVYRIPALTKIFRFFETQQAKKDALMATK